MDLIRILEKSSLRKGCTVDLESGAALSHVLVNSQLAADTGALCVGELDMGVAEKNKTNTSLPEQI